MVRKPPCDFDLRMTPKRVVDVFLPECALDDLNEGETLEDLVRRRNSCFSDGFVYDDSQDRIHYNIRIIPSPQTLELEQDLAEKPEPAVKQDGPLDTDVIMPDVEELVELVQDVEMKEKDNTIADAEMVSIEEGVHATCDCDPAGGKKQRVSSPSPPPPPEPLMKPDSAPELTDEMLQENQDKLNADSSNEVIAQNGPNKVLLEDLATLRGTEWLSDPVVDNYLHLIRQRSTIEGQRKIYSFYSTFYSLLSSAKGLDKTTDTTDHDIFVYELIFFPVCVGHHWRLITVEPRKKVISAYNSSTDFKDLQICKNIQRFMVSEEKKQTKLRGEGDASSDAVEWELNFVKDLPQQKNGSDCGVFTLQYAEYLSRNQPQFDFEQIHMPYYRQRIMFEIISSRLLL
ncbi:Sentrin-specific protease 1 [Orchesella cincta]|uniref:Sentrin-specific protease 1 n=1 Tax=Orchesella cincta TaxID=48709 RepID=A0A1D2MRU0_ORCCI|nr:Sentrin-specific protease 1 [Orchesella cincta]